MMTDTLKEYDRQRATSYEAIYHRPDSRHMSCCWLPHVRRADLQRFISGLHAVLVPGAAVVIADTCAVPGLGSDFITPDNEPDTYRRRQLETGDSQVILKNYYDRQELIDLFAEHADDLQIHHGQHFWWLSYYLKA